MTGGDALLLDDPAALEVSLAGGKGAGLARLRQAGLPVPDGFVLPAGADGVAAAYAALGERLGVVDPVVAVRSSAAGEDGAVASAAGLLRTVLGVRGTEAVARAAEECVASGTSRALAAYGRGGVGAVAVVVQALVPAEVSGVAFTVHPVTGDPETLVVEASWGLGEAVVSARVVPEHLQVDRRTGRVLERLAGRAAYRLDYDGNQLVHGTPPAGQVLDDAALAAVVDAALRAEAVLGGPADVEWALADGRVVLLQARPVTAAGPPPGSRPPAG